MIQGHAYNTFPKMGDSWIPDDIFDMEPLIRNFFENTSTVQVNCFECWIKFLLSLPICGTNIQSYIIYALSFCQSTKVNFGQRQS